MRIPLAQEIQDRAIELYLSGKTMREVGDEMGLAGGTIQKILKRNNVKARSLQILSDEEMLAGFENCKISDKLLDLAKRWGISDSQVRYHFKRLMPEKFYKRERRQYDADDNLFKDLTKEYDAWMLGWVWSDGSVHNVSDYFRIYYHKKDKELDNKFLLAGGKARLKGKSSNCHVYTLHSKEVRERLISLGCMPNKTKIIKMPTMPELNMKAFLRGLIEGDGWVTTKSRTIDVGLSSGTIDFVFEVQKFLLNMGISTGIREKRGYGVSYSLQTRSVIDAKNLLAWIYDGSELFFLSRKRDKYLNWKKTWGDYKFILKPHKATKYLKPPLAEAAS